MAIYENAQETQKIVYQILWHLRDIEQAIKEQAKYTPKYKPGTRREVFKIDKNTVFEIDPETVINCFCANCLERIIESEEIEPDQFEISLAQANGRMPGCKKCSPEDYKARCIRRADKEKKK